MSDPRCEDLAFERETRELLTAAAARESVCAGAEIDVYLYDGSITIRHAEQEGYDPNLPWRLASHLRSGRTFDPTKPTDWHLRSITPVYEEKQTGVALRVGTTFGFSRTYRAPVRYSEPSIATLKRAA